MSIMEISETDKMLAEFYKRLFFNAGSDEFYECISIEK